MLVSDFDFDLPKSVIAQSPTLPREYARMLCYDRNSGMPLDAHFFDLPKFLRPGDVLVMNNSKVMPVRVRLKQFGGSAEVLFVEMNGGFWKTLVRPGKKFRIGNSIVHEGVTMIVRAVLDGGFRLLEVDRSQDEMKRFFLKYGEMPVPPYITGTEYRNEDYNTVYSKNEGSVAAPTAGLHFTKQLLARLRSRGVQIEYVTLHVGPGTFLPMKVKDSRWHRMHSERYQMSSGVASRLNKCLADGRRIIAVGTTSLRVLEANYDRSHGFSPGCFSTDIFIAPGYKWKAISGLITNFHLPKSTLLMLVAALIGRDKVLRLYSHALVSGYRFYSFGDGMLIT